MKRTVSIVAALAFLGAGALAHAGDAPSAQAKHLTLAQAGTTAPAAGSTGTGTAASSSKPASDSSGSSATTHKSGKKSTGHKHHGHHHHSKPASEPSSATEK